MDLTLLSKSYDWCCKTIKDKWAHRIVIVIVAISIVLTSYLQLQNESKKIKHEERALEIKAQNDRIRLKNQEKALELFEKGKCSKMELTGDGNIKLEQ